MTNLPNRARLAGLVALALTIATAALPVQASGLSYSFNGGNSDRLRVIEDGGNSVYDYGDCLSRNEIKHYFSNLGLRQISVQRADKHSLYLVSGYVRPSEKATGFDLKRQSLTEMGSDMSSSKKVRYVLVFDACHEEIVEQILPKKAELPM